MSIFATILNKIFPHEHPANAASGATVGPAASAKPTPGSATPPPGTPTTSSTVAAQGSQPSVTPMPAVDVEQILMKMQEGNAQQLNWRTSIVDLLKLLGLDSSLESRKQLASELHYSGNPEDSATMNIWLHREVMQKLAENGGIIPAELKG